MEGEIGKAMTALHELSPNILEWLEAKELDPGEFEAAMKANIVDSVIEIGRGNEVSTELIGIAAYAFMLGWVTREKRGWR